MLIFLFHQMLCFFVLQENIKSDKISDKSSRDPASSVALMKEKDPEDLPVIAYVATVETLPTSPLKSNPAV